jgi:hypothetical protein
VTIVANRHAVRRPAGELPTVRFCSEKSITPRHHCGGASPRERDLLDCGR